MRNSISSEASAGRMVVQQRRRSTGAIRLVSWMAGIGLALMLIGCGGGSSSSGAGTGPGETGPAPGSPAPSSGGTAGNRFAGTYNGFATVTLSAPGVPAETITGTIQIVVDAQGNVVSDPGSGASGTGRLNGNSFTVTVPGARFNQAGVACGGSMLVRGTISGDTIDGTIAGDKLVCNGIPIQMNGNYSAVRAAAGTASRAAASPPWITEAGNYLNATR